MRTVAEIIGAINKLSADEFAQLRDWMLEYDPATITEIRKALAEPEAELKRGEGLSSEEIRKQLGLR